jgi:FAD/FMN-containing dehydrogenase/Fe-S oxidoreductase
MQGLLAEQADLADALQRVVQGEVRFDGLTRMLYSTDASLYQIQPVGVVIPHTMEDVQATVELAAKRRTPILARGAGSSLAGQAVGAAIVLDFSKHLDRILAINAEAQTATVQPGVSVAVLNRALAPLGLMLGPDPASADRATIGGGVGNNATGSHSILYGMMADAVLAASVILADSSQARFEAKNFSGLAERARQDSLEGRIYRRTPEILSRVMPEILASWPKHWRRASGYNLDRLAAPLLPPHERSRLSFDSPFRPAICDPQAMEHFNLAQLLTGSEGTLAVMTDVTLRLARRPQRTAVAVVHFDRLLDACTAVVDILETEPSAAELLDKQLLDLARAQPEWAKKIHFVEGDPAAVLLTEYYGASEQELNARIERLEIHLRRRGWRGAIVRVLDAPRQADIWSVRKAGLNLLTSRRGDFKPVPGIEDVSTPPERLTEYMADILEWCRQQEAIPDVAVYAHASAGCLHVRPLVNVKSPAGVAVLQAMGEYAVELCLRYGGAMSGEHGDGLARSGLNTRLFGPTLYQAMCDIKEIFDPQGLLNPGKIVHAPPVTANLRMGPDYKTMPLHTVFDWSADFGLAGAIEMCNGAGVCRKLGAGVMCPSFMATRDEADSTRGRANALRNALAGRIPHDELFSPNLYGVMDLCLGCKACKSECPSSVDMARIKAEYLTHYYQRNGLPIFNRLMGMLPTLNDLFFRAARAAEIRDADGQVRANGLISIANGILSSRLSRWVQTRVGIHLERSLPAYAPQSFEDWFNQRPTAAKTASTAASSVILFHDTWVNYNEPHIGRAAVQVLEATGYAVRLAIGRKCCGRPLLTGGQAHKARAWVDHNVALLAPFANQGIPIVGVEPSCILTLRDEYPALASDKKRARLLAAQALTFEEFVMRESRVGRFAVQWQDGARQALLHGHCHTRALVGNDTSVSALRLAGYRVETIPSGCCGMAGDFGYETDHYEISRAIGEDRLLPTVRAAAPSTIIVASGTSCRHQIEHFTGRRALHLAEALARAVAR